MLDKSESVQYANMHIYSMGPMMAFMRNLHNLCLCMLYYPQSIFGIADAENKCTAKFCHLLVIFSQACKYSGVFLLYPIYISKYINYEMVQILHGCQYASMQ